MVLSDLWVATKPAGLNFPDRTQDGAEDAKPEFNLSIGMPSVDMG